MVPSAILQHYNTVSRYPTAVVVFVLAGLGELLTEPLWLLTQRHLMPRIKVPLYSLIYIFFWLTSVCANFT